MIISTRRRRYLLWLAVISPIVLFSFNNCAPSHEGSVGGLASFSSNTECDAGRIANFQKIVHPFLLSHCSSCHIEGGEGLGTFSSPDVNLAFQAFQATGLSKVSTNAVTNHKPPHTGEFLRPSMDTINQLWPQAEDDYLSCLAKSDGGLDESLLTASKAIPSLVYNIGSVNSPNPVSTVLRWDLDMAADLDDKATRTVPVEVSITVKLLIRLDSNGRLAETLGYTFSNPTIRVKDSNSQIVAETIFIYLNGQLIPSETTFTPLSRVVSGTVEQPLMVADANTLVAPVSPTDKVAIYFRRLIPTNAVDGSSPPATPILSMRDAGGTNSTSLISASRTANVTILRDAGVTRWCLTQNPTKPASTQATCEGEGPINGWHVSRPGTMAITGADGPKTIYLWVANAYLQINNTAAQYAVTLDTVAPPAATISSSGMYSGIQVAQLSINHASDVAGWCVFEHANGTAPATPGLSDPCWRWGYDGSKPSNVGFNGAGVRYVWAWVRDAAGNISPVSNRLNFTNNLGAVTFSQLKGPDSEAAVFTRYCFQCHGDAVPAAPGYQQLRLQNYLSVTADPNTAGRGDQSIIVARTNDPINPMPNVSSGMMDVRYRNLIRLWVSERNELRANNQPPQ